MARTPTRSSIPGPSTLIPEAMPMMRWAARAAVLAACAGFYGLCSSVGASSALDSVTEVSGPSADA